MTKAPMGPGKRKIDGHTVYAALVIALGILLYWWMFYSAGYSSGGHQERAQIEREHYAADAGDRLANDCGSLTGADFRKCAYEVVNTERESKREESDLAAQWKAADWVLWAAVVAGAQLIATVIGLIFIKGTLDATWKAVEDTSEATEAMRTANEIAREETRPILAFAGIEWEEFGNTPERRLAHFHWKNVGRRPARLLRLEIGREEINQGEQADWNTLLQDFGMKQHDSAGLIIMPEGVHRSTGIMVSPFDFQDGPQGPVRNVYLLARAFYTNAISGEHEREFSTKLVVRALPLVNIPRPPQLPAEIEWDDTPRVLLQGAIPGPVLGYDLQSIDDANAVQMT